MSFGTLWVKKCQKLPKDIIIKTVERLVMNEVVYMPYEDGHEDNLKDNDIDEDDWDDDDTIEEE